MTEKLTTLSNSLKAHSSYLLVKKNSKKKQKKKKNLEGMCIPEAVCFCICLCLPTWML